MSAVLRSVCSALLLLFLVTQRTHASGPQAIDKAENTRKTISVKKDTQVLFHIQQPLSSANAHNGQFVRIVVQEDVWFSGVLVIPKGADGTGVVFGAHPAIPGKRDGTLLIKPVDLILPDGRHVKMSDNPAGYDDCDGVFGPCWLEYSLFAPVVFPLKWGADLSARDHKAEGKDVTQTTALLIQGYTRQRFQVSKISQP